MGMKKAELFFVPLPAMGHIVSILEFAKMLVDRDDRFSVTVLVMKPRVLKHDALNSYINSFTASASERIHFHHLPQLDSKSVSASTSRLSFSNIICRFIDDQKPVVRDAVKQLMTQSKSIHLAGFVFDMYCTSMADIADELNVPSYVFFASGAASLGLVFHLQSLHDHQGVDISQLPNSNAELVIPSYANSVPPQVLPSAVADREGGRCAAFLKDSRGMRGMKGILVNTFLELESHAMNSFFPGTTLPIYPVGPMLNIDHREHLVSDPTNMDIINWLDDQPPASVVFLCFGSLGFFSSHQVKEIAQGLERSGHRFLWSLRQPPAEDEIAYPSDYINFERVLPEGFLDRTTGIGRVINWAPQLAILEHPSVGGFVSHCGWNSILESIWYGVPVATWPLHSEQQLNAFQMVKELELAVAIRLDSKYNDSNLVCAMEIENGIKKLMDSDNKIRMRVKEMKEKSRNALIEGGSSYIYLERFIEEMVANII